MGNEGKYIMFYPNLSLTLSNKADLGDVWGQKNDVSLGEAKDRLVPKVEGERDVFP